MEPERAIELVIDELRKAEEKHPTWPDDPIHASAILAEESGELVQACIDYYYSDSDGGNAVIEAAQCGAMALRFLINVGSYVRKPEHRLSPANHRIEGMLRACRTRHAGHYKGYRSFRHQER